jgi:hypothetical protein
MPRQAGTFEGEPIRGDTFVDRVLGVLVVFLFGVGLATAFYRIAQASQPVPEGVYKAIQPMSPGGEPLRIAMIVAGMIAGAAVAWSSAASIRVALGISALRLLVDVAIFPSMPRDRFMAMQVFFDICMVAYCDMRVRAKAT